MNQVVRWREVHAAFAPLHAVSSVYSTGNQPVAFPPRNDCARLVTRKFAAIDIDLCDNLLVEGKAVLLPVHQIARRSNAVAGGIAVILRIGHKVGAIVRFHQTRIFDTAGPFVLALCFRLSI